MLYIIGYILTGLGCFYGWGFFTKPPKEICRGCLDSNYRKELWESNEKCYYGAHNKHKYHTHLIYLYSQIYLTPTEFLFLSILGWPIIFVGLFGEVFIRLINVTTRSMIKLHQEPKLREIQTDKYDQLAENEVEKLLENTQ